MTKPSRVLAALVAGALGLGFAAAAAAKPPVWTVHAGGTTITLFGSVHLLPPGLDWRPEALDDALAGADELWFELPITAETDNQAAAESLVRGGLPKGRSLTSMLTEEEAKRLIAAGVELNCAPEALDRMQPWMADLTLSIAEDARGGASATDGVEGQIQAVAPAATRRRAFETANEQIEFLAGAPLRDQLASLNWTVSEIEDDPASYQRVVGEWMAGDVVGLQRDALEPLQRISPTLYARLIEDRNRRWALTLANRLKKPGKVVVVVGVGHLVGPSSLPALMRAKGFAVDGP